jgi:polar amino acid transport system substrate-binding protein
MRNLLVACVATVVLALGSLVHAQTAACKGLLASGNPQYPPYLWRDPADQEQLIGASQAMMQWLSKEVGVTIELRFVGPWSRVQEEARNGRIDLIAGAFFTLPRTEYMDYVYPPFRETRSVVLVRESSKLKYSRWADLQGREGITVVNNSFGEEFDRFMRDKLKLSRVATLEQGLRMLEIGRGEFMLYEDSPAEAYMGSLGIKGLKSLQPPVAQERLYLTLSHKSACNTPELRGALTRAMYKLQREGLMAGFVKEGVQRWKDTPAANDGR